jgi:hypothetical protein
MAEKEIVIGRVMNVTGMVGASAGIVLCAFAIVCPLFRGALASILPPPFSRPGSLRNDAPCTCARRNSSEMQRHIPNTSRQADW